MSEASYTRRSARVLLVDEEGRLLLFKWRRHPKEPVQGFCWITPGGGIEDGESLEVAAARELLEETGLRVVPEDLGGQVAVAGGYADLGWAEGDFWDHFYFLRLPRHEVDTGGFEKYENEYFVEFRWWSVEELTATEEAVYPLGLVPLLRDLLAGRRPAEPVELPWHH